MTNDLKEAVRNYLYESGGPLESIEGSTPWLVSQMASIIDRINARCLPACNSATNPAAHQLAYDVLVITGERT